MCDWSTIKSASKKNEFGWMDGDLYQFHIPLTYDDFSRRLVFFFNQTKCSVSILQPKWHVDISIWHFCRLTVEIATWEDRYLPPLGSTHAEWAATLHLWEEGPCRWPPIQDPLLNNFSQWEAINSTVLDARLIRSKRHRNDCVNEAQTDCYYQVICCVCCMEIYQLCVSLYFILLFVSS